MQEIIYCPGCRRRLNLPDDAIGRLAQCPACQRTFMAEMSLANPPGAAAGGGGGDQQSRRCRRFRDPRRPRIRRIEAASTTTTIVPGNGGETTTTTTVARLNRVAPRGGEILTFGLLALLPCFVTSIIFGLIAWIMANSDLAEMRTGRMDPRRRGPHAGGAGGSASPGCSCGRSRHRLRLPYDDSRAAQRIPIQDAGLPTRPAAAGCGRDLGSEWDGSSSPGRGRRVGRPFLRKRVDERDHGSHPRIPVRPSYPVGAPGRVHGLDGGRGEPVRQLLLDLDHHHLPAHRALDLLPRRDARTRLRTVLRPIAGGVASLRTQDAARSARVPGAAIADGRESGRAGGAARRARPFPGRGRSPGGGVLKRERRTSPRPRSSWPDAATNCTTRPRRNACSRRSWRRTRAGATTPPGGCCSTCRRTSNATTPCSTRPGNSSRWPRGWSTR